MLQNLQLKNFLARFGCLLKGGKETSELIIIFTFNEQFGFDSQKTPMRYGNLPRGWPVQKEPHR